MKLLNGNILQYIMTPKFQGGIWNQGFVPFARLKNHTVVFTKARKARMDMLSNARSVAWLREESIINKIPKCVLQSMNVGLKGTHIKFLKIKEFITKEIGNEFWLNSESQELKMGTLIQNPIVREIGKRLLAIITSQWRLNLDILPDLKHVIDVKTNVRPKLITMIIQSLWMSFGFVESVTEKSTEYLYQRERLNLETSKEDAIVQTTEETCREKSEAVSPPRNRSVGLLWPKVIEWLRHTAGCSFYQGQCITNDLWVQNLRSTGI